MIQSDEPGLTFGWEQVLVERKDARWRRRNAERGRRAVSHVFEALGGPSCIRTERDERRLSVVWRRSNHSGRRRGTASYLAVRIGCTLFGTLPCHFDPSFHSTE